MFCSLKTFSIIKNEQTSLEADTLTVLTAFILTEKRSVKIVKYLFICGKNKEQSQ
jgi:hypothetical protein